MSKEYDYAIEYSKIFINLATALLGLTLTFVSQIAGNSSYRTWFVLIILVAWVLWVTSIHMGAKSISIIVALTAGGDDDKAGRDPDAPDENDGDNVFNPELKQKLNLQRGFFLAGFVVAIVPAFLAAVASK